MILKKNNKNAKMQKCLRAKFSAREILFPRSKVSLCKSISSNLNEVTKDRMKDSFARRHFCTEIFLIVMIFFL